MERPEDARVLVVPAAGALSEAVGTCGGSSTQCLALGLELSGSPMSGGLPVGGCPVVLSSCSSPHTFARPTLWAAHSYSRMLGLAEQLKQAAEFQRRPQRHLVVAAADTPRNLLGELGSLAYGRLVLESWTSQQHPPSATALAAALHCKLPCCALSCLRL